MKNLLVSYMHDLEHELHLKDMLNADMLAEFESRLLDSVDASIRRRLNQADAEKEAPHHFGLVKVITSIVKIFRPF